MARQRRQDFVLGLFVICILALFVGSFLFLYPQVGGATQRIVVRFNHDDGMAPVKESSAVLLSGAVEVGKVTAVAASVVQLEIGGVPRERLVIDVTAEVDQAIPLYENCRITTNQPPVGGPGVLVILSVGTPDHEEVGARPIEGLPPQSLAAAIGQLSERLMGPGGILDKVERLVDADREGSLIYKVAQSLDDVNALTAELRVQMNPKEERTLLAKIHIMVDDVSATLVSVREELSAGNEATAIAKIHVLLDSLNAALGEAKGLIAENRPALRGTLENMELASKTINEDLLAALKAEFDRDDPGSLLGKLHVGMTSLNEAMRNVEGMSDEAQALLVSNKPALQAMIDNLNEMTQKLNTAVGEIMVAPWRLFKPPTGDVKRLEAFEAARQFAEAAANLEDAAGRLEGLMAATSGGAATPAMRAEIEAVRQRVREAFARFQQAEEFLWEKMK